MINPRPKDPRIHPSPNRGGLSLFPEYEIANPIKRATMSQTAQNMYSIDDELKCDQKSIRK